ncbi:MAG: N-acetyltransferase [Prevotella sp.]|nr:N-acetyltransferase [Prevotella sp.]
MSNVLVKKVTTEKQMSDFISLSRTLYKDNNLYVPDLDVEVRNFFNPKENHDLAFADVQPFIAIKDGKVVGRVAGIVSHKSNATWNKNIVRFTFLEFIDDRDVSQALLDAVAAWGAEKGMNEIQGPMGITDFDKEGMLVEDFHLRGCFMEFWNPSYYKDHMEALGFDKATDWLQIRFKVPEEVPARFQRVADYAKQEFGIHMVRKSKKEIRGDYGKKVFSMLNQAFAPLYGFAPFSDKQVDDILDRFLPLVDLDMLAIAEDDKGELAGVAITCRDFSDGIQRSRGKLFPFGWFHILRALKFGKQDKAQLMIIGIRPEMQGMGVNAAMFAHLIPIYHRLGIKWCETNPQLETNVRELSQWKPLSPETVKRRRCWRKEIERSDIKI